MAKAVLTLAAFAKEFGDLLPFPHEHLDQENPRHQLTMSLAFLKGYPILAKSTPGVNDLNNLIKETLKMTRNIYKLEKLSIENPKDADFVRPDEVDYYWIIMTVIACANKVTILISEE